MLKASAHWPQNQKESMDEISPKIIWSIRTYWTPQLRNVNELVLPNIQVLFLLEWMKFRWCRRRHDNKSCTLTESEWIASNRNCTTGIRKSHQHGKRRIWLQHLPSVAHRQCWFSESGGRRLVYWLIGEHGSKTKYTRADLAAPSLLDGALMIIPGGKMCVYPSLGCKVEDW